MNEEPLYWKDGHYQTEWIVSSRSVGTFKILKDRYGLKFIVGYEVLTPQFIISSKAGIEDFFKAIDKLKEIYELEIKNIPEAEPKK